MKTMSEFHEEQLLSQFNKSEKIRRDFIANVSHELRTPLTVISGYLELLINETENNQLLSIYQQMRKQSARMHNLVNDLLLLSNLESTALRDIAVINVPTMLEHIINDAKKINEIGQHNFTINVDKKLLIHGQQDELKSIFSNLIINAVKYTPSPGDIVIDWYACEANAIFSVHDSGIGIEEKHIPRLTERFYRVDKSRSRDHGGTGLGLAIVKHAVIRHQGHLDIESQVGAGSTFRVTLPKQLDTLLSPM